MKKKYLKSATARFCLSLAIILIFSLSASAQREGGSVSGIVSDLTTPVSNTQVTLISIGNQSQIAFTDTSGKYVFENVAAGTYSLSAELANGVKITKQVQIGKNQTLTADLTFGVQTPSPTIKFGEVTVIAAGTAQPIDVVSKSVSLVSNEEISNRNEISITDALRTIPGLRIQQSGGFGRISTVKIRGLRNQDTAVLIDGQRFRDAAAITGDASPFLSDLQVTDVERVEILRGSGSSLYGTNAIGGVFDVKTDNFQKGFRGNLLAEGGGLGEFRGRANFGGDFNEKSFYNLGLAHTNFSKGIDGDDAARNTSVKTSARFNLSNYANLTGRFYFSDAFVQLNSSPDIIGNLPASGVVEARPLSRAELQRYENGTDISTLNVGNATFVPDANDLDDSQASRFYNFNIALDGILSRFANYRVSYQNLTTKRINRNGPGGVRPDFFSQPSGATRGDNDGNIQTFQAKTDFLWRSNTITTGYEFEREKFVNNNFRVNSNVINNFTRAAQTSNTLFAQDQLAAFDQRLQLSGAVRAQFFSLQTPNFSANSPYRGTALNKPPAAYTADGSVAYFFRATGTKIRAHVGNGYRVPALFERFGSSIFGNSLTPFGDPLLKPERSVAFDAGVDNSFRANRLRLSATYFYTRLLKTIGFDFPVSDINGTPRSFGGYINTKGGIARGGEFSAEFKPTAATNIFASYTFTKSVQREPQFGTLKTFGVPTQQFSLVATQRFDKRLTISFDFVATSTYLAPIFQSYGNFDVRVYRFKGNRKGDLTAAYEIPTAKDKLRVRLFGTVENIFNRDYYENGFRTARATARGGISLSF